MVRVSLLRVLAADDQELAKRVDALEGADRGAGAAARDLQAQHPSPAEAGVQIQAEVRHADAGNGAAVIGWLNGRRAAMRPCCLNHA